jgi:hypothetical protein
VYPTEIPCVAPAPLVGQPSKHRLRRFSMATSRRSAPRIYELLVRLSDVEPEVWRRLRLSSGATLSRAARAIAVTVGWPLGRPYAFTAGAIRYEGTARIPDDRRAQNGSDGNGHGPSPDEIRLRHVLPDAGGRVELEYGNGHAWHMEVRLERLLPPGNEIRTPFCVDGAGEAPPVDVGGPWAYEEWRGDPAGNGHRAGWDHELGAAHGESRPVRPGFNAAAVNAELDRLKT